MTQVSPAAAFDGMAEEFIDAFGNADVVLTIGGVTQPAPVRAIVRTPEDIVDRGGYERPGVVATGPYASFNPADVPGLADGDSFVHAGVTWIIREPRHDGRAMLRCDLHKDEN